MTPAAGRPVSESKSIYTEVAMPNDANPLGTLFGGKVMAMVDLAASIAAKRHSRCPVVTASIDNMSFHYPVRIGELVTCYSQVNRVFTTSMEVGVRVCVENLQTGELRHTSSAYLTFVALDEAGNRRPVPPVIPETEDEKRRYEDALKRRDYRLELRKRTEA
ncbi:acyl-CoA thioesterase [Bryobacterales bacterium F-183]|nr:acyl-CoA thioesterase [Bryobacterales bacterium F-183]